MLLQGRAFCFINNWYTAVLLLQTVGETCNLVECVTYCHSQEAVIIIL